MMLNSVITAEPPVITTERPEHVVLLDARGHATGVAPKRDVHGAATPLHLGFSCYVVDRRGRVLLTRRASSKATWPGAWSNACCGHPARDESLRAAVTRRLHDELGVRATRLALAIPDFVYRATMANGIVEHELCPVVVAEVDGTLRPDPDETSDVQWVEWSDLVRRAERDDDQLSPWSVQQVSALAAQAGSPVEFFDRLGSHDGLLDVPAAPTMGASDRHRVPAIRLDPFAPVRAETEPRLRAFLASRAAALVAVDDALAPVAEAVVRLVLAGGKRLRPAFVYWGHRAVSRTPDEHVHALAGAVELLHTFALVHDDVMDRSDTRRGQPAVHRALSDEHVRARLTGDGDWFGTSAAILAGDLVFVWADALLDAAGVDGDAMARARRVFTDLRVEVMAGQYLDLRHAGRPAGTADDARQVALLKSGRYTVTRPLLLGAALARTEPEVERALRTYGDAVGLAFQMRDDVLGLFGDPLRTGKSTTDDLRSGKRTVLALRALALTDGAARAALVAALGDPEVDERTADRCRDIVATSGALASVEALIRAEHARALVAIADLAPDARDGLRALASVAIERDA
jgi:geranylgeranyl diphosphate synthase, type I